MLGRQEVSLVVHWQPQTKHHTPNRKQQTTNKTGAAARKKQDKRPEPNVG